MLVSIFIKKTCFLEAIFLTLISVFFFIYTPKTSKNVNTPTLPLKKFILFQFEDKTD